MYLNEGGGGDVVVTLAALVASVASCHPDHPALIDGEHTLTWAEYESRSAALARALIESGVEPGDRVAVMAFTSRWTYVAAHAAVRARAVFVPVDPMSPPAAQYQVLANCRPAALIAGHLPLGRLQRLLADPESVLDPAPLVDIPTWLCDPTPTAGAAAPAITLPMPERIVGSVDAVIDSPGAAPLPEPEPDDPAYLIHTSGSTGVPKGILHSHRSAMAYATRAAKHRELTEQDRVAGMAPFHFDTSTFELWAAPVAASAVVVIPETHMRMPASFAELTATTRTSVWYGVSSFFQQLTERGALERYDHSAVRLVMFCGEPYPAASLARFMKAVPHARFENIYGPAEVNECTAYRLPARPEPDTDVPIGSPWDGVTARLMNDDGTPSGPGTPGELWIDAPTRMMGYWNNPAATAERFHTVDGVTWCRTGDLCTTDGDGNFVFLGRIDNQVKVRGARIELEGVESVLGDAPGVLHAVVGPGGDDRGLVASIVAEPGVAPDERELRRYCSSRLAALAVPERFRVVTSFPLTQSGKIDRTTVRRETLDWVAEVTEIRVAPGGTTETDTSTGAPTP